MNRQQLAHILRAACEVTGDPDVVVVGSQSILGTYDEDDLPPAATMSMEADLAWQRDSGDRERAETVNGAIGELSGFHETNGYFPEGVSLGTVILPEGWQDRLHGWGLASSAPAKALFLDKHDLVISKLAAFRDKDRAFAAALIETSLVAPRVLRERVALLPESVPVVVSRRILTWLDGISPTG
jgi:hypothetical protein